MKSIKLNVGASPRWRKEGWAILDHKVGKNGDSQKSVSSCDVYGGSAEKMNVPDACISVLFCSHMVEHIPHSRLPKVFDEFMRVLEPGGLLRILTPDLRKLTTAYVNNDDDFWTAALAEDENIRTDLGRGGSLLNFIVSPGQDTALFSRNLEEFISGYAHLACYDYDMLSRLLKNAGFEHITQKNFCESCCAELEEPLHVDGLPPVWETMNQDFYDRHGLTHFYDEKTKQYNINFSVTGFDRDPVVSLIVECRKPVMPCVKAEKSLNHRNYERYGTSLLGDEMFSTRLDVMSDAIAAFTKKGS